VFPLSDSRNRINQKRENTFALVMPPCILSLSKASLRAAGVGATKIRNVAGYDGEGFYRDAIIIEVYEGTKGIEI
jgi:hypothetical protein